MSNPNRQPMTAEEYRKAQAKAMTERQLLDGILGTPRHPGIALALGWRGYHTHRSPALPGRVPRPSPLVRRGRLVFAELKRQLRSEPTPEQAAWLEDLGAVEAAVAEDLGAVYSDARPYVRVYLWRPLDLLDGTIETALR